MTGAISACTHARNVLMARGFSEGEAVALLCPVIGEAYRSAAGYARGRSVDNWGAASSSPSTILCTVSDELYTMAADIDPRPAPARPEEEH